MLKLVAGKTGLSIASLVQERVHRLDVSVDDTKDWMDLLMTDLKEYVSKFENPSMEQSDTQIISNIGPLVSTAGLSIRYVTQEKVLKNYAKDLSSSFYRVLLATSKYNTESDVSPNDIYGIQMVAIQGSCRCLETFGLTPDTPELQDVFEWITACVASWSSSDNCKAQIQLLWKSIEEFLNVWLQVKESAKGDDAATTLISDALIISNLLCTSHEWVSSSLLISDRESIAEIWTYCSKYLVPEVPLSKSLLPVNNIIVSEDYRLLNDEENALTMGTGDGIVPAAYISSTLATSDLKAWVNIFTEWVTDELTASEVDSTGSVMMLSRLCGFYNPAITAAALATLTKLIVEKSATLQSVLDLQQYETMVAALGVGLYRAGSKTIEYYNVVDIRPLLDVMNHLQTALGRTRATDSAAVKKDKRELCSDIRRACISSLLYIIHTISKRTDDEEEATVVTKLKELIFQHALETSPILLADILFVNQSLAVQGALTQSLRSITPELAKLTRYTKATQALILTSLCRIIENVSCREHVEELLAALRPTLSSTALLPNSSMQIVYRSIAALLKTEIDDPTSGPRVSRAAKLNQEAIMTDLLASMRHRVLNTSCSTDFKFTMLKVIDSLTKHSLHWMRSSGKGACTSLVEACMMESQLDENLYRDEYQEYLNQILHAISS